MDESLKTQLLEAQVHNFEAAVRAVHIAIEFARGRIPEISKPDLDQIEAKLESVSALGVGRDLDFWNSNDAGRLMADLEELRHQALELVGLIQ